MSFVYSKKKKTCVQLLNIRVGFSRCGERMIVTNKTEEETASFSQADRAVGYQSESKVPY